MPDSILDPIQWTIGAAVSSHIELPFNCWLVNNVFGEFYMQCKVCMQTFMCTTTEVKCREHAEAKHPKSDVEACFPHLKK
jgi:hypothetical protein